MATEKAGRPAAKHAILRRRGALLVDRRKARGLSQAGLARAIDPPCDQSTISGIERGTQDMSVGLACRLAEVLDLRVEDLLAGQLDSEAVAS